MKNLLILSEYSTNLVNSQNFGITAVIPVANAENSKGR